MRAILRELRVSKCQNATKRTLFLALLKRVRRLISSGDSNLVPRVSHLTAPGDGDMRNLETSLRRIPTEVRSVCTNDLGRLESAVQTADKLSLDKT